MIKHVLVPTDGSPHAMIGVRYAVALAKRHEAVLHALHVIDVKLLEGPMLRDITSSLGQEPFANLQNKVSIILEERGRVALAEVEKACEEAGVKCAADMTTGVVSRCILDKSELVDIIVLGRSGEHSQWLDGLMGSTSEAVARHSNRPVLVTTTDSPSLQRLLLAYDGSERAREALKTAAVFARDWGASLLVMTVGDEGSDRIQKEAGAYLEPHGVAVEYRVATGDTAPAIVQAALDWNADLIIMGAYGHSRVIEVLMGSVTAHVLNNAPCPVLLAR